MLCGLSLHWFASSQPSCGFDNEFYRQTLNHPTFIAQVILFCTTSPIRYAHVLCELVRVCKIETESLLYCGYWTLNKYYYYYIEMPRCWFFLLIEHFALIVNNVIVM